MIWTRPLVVAALLLCAACGAQSPPPVSASTTAPVEAPVVDAPQAVGSTVVLSGKRGFAVAELGYITAAQGVDLLIDARIIEGERATFVRKLNADAAKWLLAGKTTLDAAEQARAAAALLGITDRINSLIDRSD